MFPITLSLLLVIILGRYSAALEKPLSNKSLTRYSNDKLFGNSKKSDHKPEEQIALDHERSIIKNDSVNKIPNKILINSSVNKHVEISNKRSFQSNPQTDWILKQSAQINRSHENSTRGTHRTQVHYFNEFNTKPVKGIENSIKETQLENKNLLSENREIKRLSPSFIHEINGTVRNGILRGLQEDSKLKGETTVIRKREERGKEYSPEFLKENQKLPGNIQDNDNNKLSFIKKRTAIKSLEGTPTINDSKELIFQPNPKSQENTNIYTHNDTENPVLSKVSNNIYDRFFTNKMLKVSKQNKNLQEYVDNENMIQKNLQEKKFFKNLQEYVDNENMIPKNLQEKKFFKTNNKINLASKIVYSLHSTPVSKMKNFEEIIKPRLKMNGLIKNIDKTRKTSKFNFQNVGKRDTPRLKRNVNDYSTNINKSVTHQNIREMNVDEVKATPNSFYEIKSSKKENRKQEINNTAATLLTNPHEITVQIPALETQSYDYNISRKKPFNGEYVNKNSSVDNNSQQASVKEFISNIEKQSVKDNDIPKNNNNTKLQIISLSNKNNNINKFNITQDILNFFPNKSRTNINMTAENMISSIENSKLEDNMFTQKIDEKEKAIRNVFIKVSQKSLNKSRNKKVRQEYETGGQIISSLEDNILKYEDKIGNIKLQIENNSTQNYLGPIIKYDVNNKEFESVDKRNSTIVVKLSGNSKKTGERNVEKFNGLHSTHPIGEISNVILGGTNNNSNLYPNSDANENSINEKYPTKLSEAEANTISAENEYIDITNSTPIHHLKQITADSNKYHNFTHDKTKQIKPNNLMKYKLVLLNPSNKITNFHKLNNKKPLGNDKSSDLYFRDEIFNDLPKTHNNNASQWMNESENVLVKSITQGDIIMDDPKNKKKFSDFGKSGNVLSATQLIKLGRHAAHQSDYSDGKYSKFQTENDGPASKLNYTGENKFDENRNVSINNSTLRINGESMNDEQYGLANPDGLRIKRPMIKRSRSPIVPSVLNNVSTILPPTISSPTTIWTTRPSQPIRDSTTGHTQLELPATTSEIPRDHRIAESKNSSILFTTPTSALPQLEKISFEKSLNRSPVPTKINIDFFMNFTNPPSEDYSLAENYTDFSDLFSSSPFTILLNTTMSINLTEDVAKQRLDMTNTTIKPTEFPWPVKREAVVEGDIVLGGLMMVHEREDSVTCGPVMPQGGIQALEAMLYTLDMLNDGPDQLLPNITLGAHILDDCDKDTYGLEMAVDFIKDGYREDGDSDEGHHKLRHHHREFNLMSEILWPVKKEAVVEGDLIIGGLMMVHEREDSVTCGPVMPQGGIQALEAMLYTLDRLNHGFPQRLLPNITLGAHILDDCDKDTYGLEMAVDFIKGSISNIDGAEYSCNKTQVRKVISGVVGAASSVTSIQVANLLRLFKIPQVSFFSTSPELSNKQRFEYFTRTIPSDHYQVKAMVDIVIRMGWSYVSIIYEESNYGIKAFEELEDLLAQYNICIAVKEKLVKDSGVADESAYDNIVQKLLTKPRARGAIVFGSDQEVAGVMRAVRRSNATGSFSWIGSDGWSARNLVSDGNEAEVEGTLSVQPQANPVIGFEEYFLNLNVENNKRNPWFIEFWEHHFQCRYPNSSRTPYNQKHTKICTGSERLTRQNTVFENQLQFVSDAVMAFGYAIRDMHLELCNGRPGLCDAMKPTKGTELLKYLKKVEFEGLSGDRFHFDVNGDGPARYNIIHFKQVSPGKYQWIRVGEYVEGELRLNMTEIQFKLGHPKPPESVCSLPCDLGQAKKYVEGESCCWHCFNCTQYQIRHPTDPTQCIGCRLGTVPDPLHVRCVDIPEEYLQPDSGWAIGAMALGSTGILITLFVCGVFIRHNDTPVVRASGRELSYVLLAGILMCYCVTYALVLRPNDIVCGIQRFGAGFCFTVVYAALLTKTNRISRIFNAGKRSAKRPSFISPRSQLIICSGLIGVQVLVNGVWMIISPARAIHHYPTREDNLLVCSSYIDASYMIAFTYPILLIVVCTVYAILTRKIPEAFNESKHIGFTMYTTCVIWLAFVPLYFGTANHVALRITSMSVTISLSAGVTVACLFSPKLYIILIRPERNVRQSMMPMRYSAINKSTTGTTNSGAGSMMAAVMVTAATCNQKNQIQRHVPSGDLLEKEELEESDQKPETRDFSTQTIQTNGTDEPQRVNNNCNGPIGVEMKDLTL